MRKKIVAGNWKMNLIKAEALALYDGLKGLNLEENQEVKVFVPYLYLDALNERANGVLVGAQNFYPADKGAFTGEVSITQLKALGIREVLVGHSERRALFGEDNGVVKQKVDAALKHGFHVTVCCGEPLDVREAGKELHHVYRQMESSLYHLSVEQMQHITIAYEPIWAIGTGKTATVDQAADMHKNIRLALREKFGEEVADATSILYGGSCNPKNAKDLFACQDIDGGLIGGASLKLDDFLQIIGS